jgi:hypothetical protein
VRWRGDGNLEFLGRIDFQVKLRGHRIELGEIEGVVCELEGVTSAVAMVHEDRLVGVVVPCAVDGDGVRQALRSKLPAHMVPSCVVCCDTLPVTANGKLDRAALGVTLAGQAESPRTGFLEARTATEAELAALFAGILGVEQVSVSDSFFELGGHSLLSMRLVSVVYKAGFTGMNVRMLAQYPTVASLAEVLVKRHEKALPIPKMSAHRTNQSFECCEQLIGMLLVGVISVGSFVLPSVVHYLMSGPGAFCYAFYPATLILTIPFYLGVVVLIKWLLVGRVRSGRVHLFSRFHLRWWLKNRVLQSPITSWILGFIQDTPAIVWFYRGLGATIGSNVSLDMPEGGMLDADLVNIGDGSRVEFSNLSTHVYGKCGGLILSTIHIGAGCYLQHCYVGSALVGNDTELLPGSNVPPVAHTGKGAVESSSVYGGAPAEHIGKRTGAHPAPPQGVMDCFVRLPLLYVLMVCHATSWLTAVRVFQFIDTTAGQVASSAYLAGFTGFVLAIPLLITPLLYKCFVGIINEGSHELTPVLAAKIWFADRYVADC